ncbi:MAG: hypothetical protein GYB36_02240 [Alphaproteobacteria bacterium]|nr:hypothetical protein [Alphaproteobacteria bacterium]
MSLHRNDTIVSIACKGDLRRVELLVAYHKVRDAVRAHSAKGVMIDARDIEVLASPHYASEMIEAFADILADPLPIALLPPLGWSDAHYTAAWKRVDELENKTGVFKTPALALDWLQLANSLSDPLELA